MAEQDTEVPTLYAWAGGMPAFERLTRLFYARVDDNPLLAPVFARVPKEHARHVAYFIAEVLGGPKTYSEQNGSHAG
ncbi:MAG: globin, partial [Cytophagales bacterium]|nr:globin [Armatimonadota bacterium]